MKMRDGNGRWYWLTILAVGNLVLWVGIAALVGLLVSDQVNLGLETELRQVQATAIAAWRGLSLTGRSTPLAVSPHSTLTPFATSQPRPTSGIAWSAPTVSPAEDPVTEEVATGSMVPEPTAAEAPAVTPALTGGGSRLGPTASPQPTPNEVAGDQSAVAGGQGAVQGASQPSPVPTPVLLTQPLLLADPAFHNLAMLNAEMERSAPGRVVQIRYQEAMLSAEIHRLCENNPDLPFRNVQTDLLRDQLVLTGEITVFGFQVEARIRGTVVARDCRPEIDIQSIAVGRVLTPQYVRDRIEQQVLEAMTWYPADYPLCLEQIMLEDTRATIWGHRR
jgi:hypothetical protein